VSGGGDQGFLSGVSNLKHQIDTHMEIKTGFRTSIHVSELELEMHVLVVTKAMWSRVFGAVCTQTIIRKN
jgi:hypothetical protein